MEGDFKAVEIEPIRGDVLLDRIFGWLSFVCAFPVLGLSISKLTGKIVSEVPDPNWLAPVRVSMIVLAMIASLLIATSRRKLIQIAAVLFVVRVVALLATWKFSGGPRFAGTELVFDLAALYYCWLRQRADLK